VRLTQIQDEVIDTAHCEGKIDPGIFARLLLHELDDVQAAISDLVSQGLLAAVEGGTYQLTDRGRAVHRAQEDAHRAAVIRRIRI
jgi:hypothetical protein